MLRAILFFYKNHRMVAERLYTFSSLNISISIYAIINFYCHIFLLVRAEQGLIFIFIFIFIYFYVFKSYAFVLRYKDSMQPTAMANKDPILLTSGNIQTPKSLWYETNRTSRVLPN